MSRFSTIEASGFSVAQGVTSLNSVKLTSLGMLGTTRPGDFPGAVCALGDPMPEKPFMQVSPGHFSLRYKVPFYVIVIGASDGVNLGDARGPAWAAADAVIDAFTIPMWMPAFTDQTTVFAMEVAPPSNIILTDTGQSAIELAFVTTIEWRI